MTDRHIYFIVTERNIENIKKTLKFNSILINEFTKNFKKIYILNLFNLKLYEKKIKFNYEEKITDQIFILNFADTKEFKKFAFQKPIVAILNIGKDPSFFNIHYQIKKFDIKLIMIMNQSHIGNRMTIDWNLKYLFSAYRHYFQKGFYYIFRFMTLINLFPKIDLLFESNPEVINYIENSRSKKIENYISLLKFSYFKETVLINSIYFDKNNLIFKNKKQKNAHIIYIDTSINHEDKTTREGKDSDNKVNMFYENLDKFLKNISKVYKMPVKISKHPSNNSSHKFYRSFEISQINTDQEIFDSEITVFTVSSAVLNAVFFKKKIINIKSKLLGDYLQNISNQYVKNLGLISYDIDKYQNIKRDELDKKLNDSIKKYENYINYKLVGDGNNLSHVKITETILYKFF